VFSPAAVAARRKRKRATTTPRARAKGKDGKAGKNYALVQEGLFDCLPSGAWLGHMTLGDCADQCDSMFVHATKGDSNCKCAPSTCTPMQDEGEWGMQVYRRVGPALVVKPKVALLPGHRELEGQPVDDFTHKDGKPLIFSTEHTYAEDVEIADAFRRMTPRVVAEEITDESGRAHFLPLGLGVEHILFQNSTNENTRGWWQYCPNAREGRTCCSQRWIATHYIYPDEMRYIFSAAQQQCNPPQDAWPFVAFV